MTDLEAVRIIEAAHGRIVEQTARIAELEALGSLIDEFGQQMFDAGDFRDIKTKLAHHGEANRTKQQIDAILKGGA
jgi:hypothetical protein